MDSYIANKGATWKAGTKTYTLVDIWLRKLDGVWEVWVAYEVKWKKRKQYANVGLYNFLGELNKEGAVVQGGESVVDLDK